MFTDERSKKTLFTESPVGIAKVALDGRFLDINQAFCTIVGYSRSEMMRKRFQDITHPEDLQGDIDEVNAVIRGEIDHYNMIKRYVTKEGKIVWVELYVTAVRNEQGKVEYFVSHVIKLPNGGRFKVEKNGNGEVTIRPTQKIAEIVRDDWKTALAILVFTVLLLADKISENLQVLLKLLGLVK